MCTQGTPGVSNTTYSFNGYDWTPFTPSTTQGTNVVPLNNVGDKVYFRGNIISARYRDYLQFKMTGKISASGNVNSIYNKETFETLKVLPAYCYKNLFSNCKSLITAPELPATTIGSYCYYCMFKDCTSLIDAPELPATTLGDNCYREMFYGCTKLVNAPELPGTALADYCYYGMFYDCKSLVEVPSELPATTLARNCYSQMFWNCSSLATAPELPATTLADSCYNNMFRWCTSLTVAPKLPAVTLANDCYSDMFYGCSKLATPPRLHATNLPDTLCYSFMFSDCSSLKAHTTKGDGWTNPWKIPTNGAFEMDTNMSQRDMFKNTGGDLPATFPGATGKQYTYYVANEPV